MKINNKQLIIALISIVVILMLILSYFFILKPIKANKDKAIYSQGATDAIIYIVNNIRSDGYIQLNIDNQEIILTEITNEK